MTLSKNILRLGSLVLLAALFLPMQAAKIDNIIKNMQKKYRSAKTLRIEFVEKSRFSLTGTENQIDGQLQMEGKERFRLESEDQVLVNDGETFWRFNKLDNQVLIDYAKKDDQEVMLNDFLYNLKDRYYSQILGEEKVSGKKIYNLKLTPKEDQQSYFTSIKMWVEDKTWAIQRIVYIDYNDNETEYIIEKMDFNPVLQQSTFKFTPPEGIDVVDLRM